MGPVSNTVEKLPCSDEFLHRLRVATAHAVNRQKQREIELRSRRISNKEHEERHVAFIGDFSCAWEGPPGFRTPEE